MSSNYKLKELHIQIKPGVTLIAEISDLTEAKSLLQHLAQEGLEPLPTPSTPPVTPGMATDDPSSVIEIRSDLPQGALSAKKILAFKNGVPQLLRLTLFESVTDAVLVLLYAVETGLKNSSIPYDDFKPLYEGQGLKTGTSLPMLLNNLKNAGYLDKRQYDTTRTLSLSPKGAQKAIEVLKSIANKN